MEQIAREVAEHLIDAELARPAAPSQLSADAWDELIARHGSNLLAEWLSRAVKQGRITAVPIQPLTRLLIAMISESSLYIARADDRSAASDAMGAVLDRLLDGLEAPSER